MIILMDTKTILKMKSNQLKSHQEVHNKKQDLYNIQIIEIKFNAMHKFEDTYSNNINAFFGKFCCVYRYLFYFISLVVVVYMKRKLIKRINFFTNAEEGGNAK